MKGEREFREEGLSFRVGKWCYLCGESWFPLSEWRFREFRPCSRGRGWCFMNAGWLFILDECYNREFKSRSKVWDGV